MLRGKYLKSDGKKANELLVSLLKDTAKQLTAEQLERITMEFQNSTKSSLQAHRTYTLAVQHALSSCSVEEAAEGFVSGLEMLHFLSDYKKIDLNIIQTLSDKMLSEVPYCVACSTSADYMDAAVSEIQENFCAQFQRNNS